MNSPVDRPTDTDPEGATGGATHGVADGVTYRATNSATDTETDIDIDIEVDLDERRVQVLVGGLPPRSAPQSLERRIRDELARRRTLPWWQRGFAAWPTAARVSFLAACSVLCGCTLLLSATLLGLPILAGSSQAFRVGSFAAPAAPPAVAALTSILELAALLARVIPTTWAFDAAAVTGLLYAALFGLAAAAYRTLYCHSSLRGNS